MSTLVAQTISNGTVSTSSQNVIQGCARAWVNFTMVITTPVINKSYNVSSVTYNAVGDYTCNFVVGALTDANYLPMCSAQTAGGNRSVGFAQFNTTLPTTAACRVKYYDSVSGQSNTGLNAYVAFFG